MPSGVTTGCAWLGRGESVTELMSFMNSVVHSCTCYSDRHASPYSTFIRQWISMGCTPSLLKKWMTEHCSSLVHVGRRPPSLHYYCAVMLHSCIVLPSVGHSSNHEYHCCQLTRKWSCVSNFYHTFNVVIWLSLVHVSSQQEQVFYLSKVSRPAPWPIQPSVQWSVSALFPRPLYLKMTTHFHLVAWLMSEATPALMASTGLTLSVS